MNLGEMLSTYQKIVVRKANTVIAVVNFVRLDTMGTMIIANGNSIYLKVVSIEEFATTAGIYNIPTST